MWAHLNSTFIDWHGAESENMSMANLDWLCIFGLDISTKAHNDAEMASVENGVAMPKRRRQWNLVRRAILWLVIILINTFAVLHLGVAFYDWGNLPRFIRASRYVVVRLSTAIIVDHWYWHRQRIAHFFAQMETTLESLGATSQFIKSKGRRCLVTVFLAIVMLAIPTQHWVWSQQTTNWAVIVTYGAAKNATDLQKRLISFTDLFTFYTATYGSRMTTACLICMVCEFIMLPLRQLKDELKFMIRTVRRQESLRHGVKVRLIYARLHHLVSKANHLFGLTLFAIFSTSFMSACSDVIFFSTLTTDFYDDTARTLLRLFTSSSLWMPSLLLYWRAAQLHHISSEIRLLITELTLHDPANAIKYLGPIDIYRPLDLNLAGYLKIDRLFILSLLSSVVTFSVMVIQLLPPRV